MQQSLFLAAEGGAFHSLTLLCVITEVKRVEDSSSADSSFQDVCWKNLHVCKAPFSKHIPFYITFIIYGKS